MIGRRIPLNNDGGFLTGVIGGYGKSNSGLAICHVRDELFGSSVGWVYECEIDAFYSRDCQSVTLHRWGGRLR